MIEQHFDPPIAARILGRVGAPEFAGRWIERVPVPAADVARRRVLLRGEHDADRHRAIVVVQHDGTSGHPATKLGLNFTSEFRLN